MSPAQPQSAGDPRRPVLDEHVGVVEQVVHHRPPAVTLQVQCEPALVAVVELEGGAKRLAVDSAGAVVLLLRRLRRPEEFAVRRLDLYHLRAEVGHETGTQRAGDHLPAVDDTDVREGILHAPPSAGAGLNLRTETPAPAQSVCS